MLQLEEENLVLQLEGENLVLESEEENVVLESEGDPVGVWWAYYRFIKSTFSTYFAIDCSKPSGGRAFTISLLLTIVSLLTYGPDRIQKSSSSSSYRLVGLVVKASASRAEGPGFESRLRRDFYGVESYQWLKHWHSSAPGVIGSALGLVGPVSVYCDWVR